MNALLDQVFAQFLPLILQGISALLGVLLIQGAGIAKARWGIEIEATHRDALHSALMSGIRAALERGDDRTAAITSAIHHATQSVPDAISALNPSTGVLQSIAEAKLREVAAQATSLAGETFTSSRTQG
ncbi:hypothetical protein [Pacificibacter marinus]|uniref:hypothetical protein n=1 Tax=Pacificibacter marinus TaxID=658057 RepID=UPI001C077949|nr:hypothetical protein [Pacificibacter marinus]MBU2867123.1 hypothetical protein [Pacificibacter marinus]